MAKKFSEKEVKEVVKYLVNEYKDELPSEINISGGEEIGRAHV